MIDLIWDLFQQKSIIQGEFKNKLQDEKLKGHQSDMDRLMIQMRELEKRHEQLKLVTLALWSLLRDHSGLVESDLRKYVEKVDLMDGRQDGKVTTKEERVNCNACDRVILNTAIVCAYCGAYSSTKPFDAA